MVKPKVYYLSTCSTSKRIINQFKLEERGFTLQDIKFEHLTPEQLEHMAELAGSYEALFSKIARKYRELKLNEQELSEDEMRNYILKEYTFLKRPVIIIQDRIYIGSGKANLKALAAGLT